MIVNNELRFEETGTGSDKVKVKAPTALSDDYTLTLPADDGDANEFLQTNGSGTLDWAAASVSPGGNNTEVQFNDSSSFGGDSDLTWNKTTNVLTATGTIEGGSLTVGGTNVVINVELQSFTVARTGSKITTISDGTVTWTPTYSGNYIGSITDGTTTQTITRGGENEIASIAVAG